MSRVKYLYSLFSRSVSRTHFTQVECAKRGASNLLSIVMVRTRGSHDKFAPWFAPLYARLARTWAMVTSAVTTDSYQFARLPNAGFPLWFPRYCSVFHWSSADLRKHPMNDPRNGCSPTVNPKVDIATTPEQGGGNAGACSLHTPNSGNLNTPERGYLVTAHSGTTCPPSESGKPSRLFPPVRPYDPTQIGRSVSLRPKRLTR